MEQKMDFLSEMENQECYLYGAVRTLELIAEDFSRHVVSWEKIDPLAPLQRTKSYSDAIFTILRVLGRIQEDMDVAITAELHENKNATATPTGDGE